MIITRNRNSSYRNGSNFNRMGLKLFLWIILCSCGLVEVQLRNQTITPYHGKKQSFRLNNQFEETCVWNDKCSIFCHMTPFNTLSIEIDNLASQKHDCNDRMTVEVFQIDFPNNVIHSRWYNGNTNISILMIENANIVDIEPNAFNSKPFNRLMKLHLTGFQTNVLKAGIFDGLPILKHIHFNNIDLRIMESELFEHCERLEMIVMVNCSEHPMKLDGVLGETNDRLDTLIISENNFKDTITSETFKGLLALEYLYLDENQIEVIGEGAFDPISESLLVINLLNNRLTTLPDNIFHLFLLTKPDFKEIELEGNIFHCDCSLYNLKLLFVEYPDKIFDNPKCTSPEHLANVSIKEARFCGDEIDVTDDVTTIDTPTEPAGTTLPSTNRPPSENNLILKCKRDFVDKQYTYQVVTLIRSTANTELKYQNSSKRNKVIVSIPKLPQDYVIVWIVTPITKTFGSIHCVFRSDSETGSKQINLYENPQTNKTYMVCVLNKTTQMINPLSCTSFETFEPTDYSTETWLPKSATTTIIGSLLTTYLVTAALSVILALPVVRIFPSLTKKSNKTGVEYDDISDLGALKTRNLLRSDSEISSPKPAYVFDNKRPSVYADSEHYYEIVYVDQKEMS